MIDLLCADPWCCNMGDVATCLATANGLAQRGIPTQRVAVPRARPTVIGGGDLIGDYPHESIYRVPGPQLLNAVGVRDEPGDLDHLQDYRFLSVRDAVSRERLCNAAGVEVDRVSLAPCPAVLLEPIPWALACQVPRWGLLQHQRDYLVIHARPELSGFANGARNSKVIAIEPAPYTWTPWEAHGWLLPMTHSPELIATVLSKAQAVITLSLHLSILALAVGTPFCIPDRGNPAQVEKCRNYWTRAGVPEVIYSGKHPVQHARSLRGQLEQTRQAELTAAEQHLDSLATACRAN